MASQLIANLPILMIIIITLLLHSVEGKPPYNCSHSVAHRGGNIPDGLIASMKEWSMQNPAPGLTESLKCNQPNARGCVTLRCKNANDGYDDWVANGCGWIGDEKCSENEMNKHCPIAGNRKCKSCEGFECNNVQENFDLQLPSPPKTTTTPPPLRIELMAFDAEAGSGVGETRGGGGAVVSTILLLFGVLLVHWV